MTNQHEYDDQSAELVDEVETLIIFSRFFSKINVVTLLNIIG